VLLDINLPDGSGLDVLREIKSRKPDSVVIMITANVLIDDTLAALRGGAYDFIGKPINLEELQVTIRNGIETQRLRKEVNLLRQGARAGIQFRADRRRVARDPRDASDGAQGGRIGSLLRSLARRIRHG
jgi:DNA-binding NtrC family response regulator